MERFLAEIALFAPAASKPGAPFTGEVLSAPCADQLFTLLTAEGEAADAAARFLRDNLPTLLTGVTLPDVKSLLKTLLSLCRPENQNGSEEPLATLLGAVFSACAGETVSLRFPAPAIRSLLQIIQSGIRRRMEKENTDPSDNDLINYYIMQPVYPCPEISFLIYDGYGVAPFYTMGRHKNKITNIFESAEAGSVLYDYIVQEIIGRRGEELRTVIMSDEHSISFLDRLIAMSY